METGKADTMSRLLVDEQVSVLFYLQEFLLFSIAITKVSVNVTLLSR